MHGGALVVRSRFCRSCLTLKVLVLRLAEDTMALSGLEIYKLLPRTNCKECGFPTCLAFAMKLAAKQAELSACPYVSEDSKAKLSAAAAPPIRLIAMATDGRKSEAGNETVMFRH